MSFFYKLSLINWKLDLIYNEGEEMAWKKLLCLQISTQAISRKNLTLMQCRTQKAVSFHLGARDGGIGPLLGATGGAESVETKRKCIHNNYTYEEKKNQSSLCKVQVLMFCLCKDL